MAHTALTSPTGVPVVSKSKFLWGSQCKKLLWHAYNAKDQIPAPDAAQQAIFDQGHAVGTLAKRMFPGGFEIGQAVTGFDDLIRLTKRALKQRRPLFEAAFAANGCCCRVDILAPALDDAWDLIEVKSTTAAKDVHLPDLAFQTWVLAMAGIKIRRCLLMHINSSFVRSGPINPEQFFTHVDLTDQVSNLAQTVEDSLDDMFSVIRRQQSPEVKIGPHCSDPYPCPLQDKCWSFLPEQNVTTLYRAGQKAFKLLADDRLALKDIPADYRLTASQTIQREAAVTGEAQVDRPAIAAFLSQLKYPVSFLDFETFSTAIPLLDGVRPYQQVPFQFSLHIVRSAGAKAEHFEFLAEGRNDPRPEFMRRRQAGLPQAGSVVVYNAAFEKARLAECSEQMPEFKAWQRKAERRMVDLLLPFRGFRYYHPNQQGSASMKAVLPVLTGRSYAGLEIQEGGTASMEFLRVTFGDVPEAERRKVRGQLARYCGQDTEGMIWIVEALERLCSS
jgi:hypothetical protein